jgi:hypothetical protein
VPIALPPAAQADEYHDLKVLVGQPEMAARTNTGYYDQPLSGRSKLSWKAQAVS